MSDPLGEELCKRHDEVKQERALWENTWRDIALKVMPPEEKYFYGGGTGAPTTLSDARTTSGVRRDYEQFDGFASQALEKYAAALNHYAMPETQRWHTFKPANRELEGDVTVQRYCEDLVEIAFDIYYQGNTQFPTATHQAYMSNGLYGPGIIFIEDRLSKGIGFQSIHVSEAYLIENAYRVVDQIHREYKLKALQAVQKFDEDRLPEKIREAAREQPDKEFTFLHCVKPNLARDINRRDYRGMPFSAYDIAYDHKQIIKVGGYKSFPYAITRHITLPGQVYSFSPSFMSLADIKTVNEMMKANIRYAQMKNYPPIMLQDVDSLRPFAVRPAALNYGYLDEQGNPTAVPFDIGGDPRFSLEMMEQKRQVIAATFYNTLFDILVETPEMTATQALIRAQEKGALLAPVVARQKAEFLNTLVTRTMQIADELGMLPQAPDVLLEQGQGLRIEYDNPLTRAQQSEGAAGILRTFEQVAQFEPYDPSVKHRFNFDKSIQYLSRIYNAPAEVMRSDEEFQERVQAEQERMQQMEAAAMAKEGSEAVRNLANAQRNIETGQRAA